MPWNESYWLVRFMFQRALAFVYLVAFLVAANQYRALLGEDGLLPLSDYVDNANFAERPSLFYRFDSDRAIQLTAWTGVGLSIVALTGVSEQFGTAVSVAVWLLLYLLYLSFVNAGQLFYGYGWESMLLETGFVAIFLGASSTAAPFLVILLLRWILFRNMVGAGLIKLRGDQCWRDLTCMDYHYETQPMPNPLTWFFHHFPQRFHKFEVGVNHVMELFVPFLYFAPQPFAAVAGVATILFQGWLMLSGNFAFLNLLTIVLAVATFSDGMLQALPLEVVAAAPVPPLHQAAVILLTGITAALSVGPVRNMLSSRQRMNWSFNPLHIVNTYGAFGSITRERYQLVIEGTDEEHPSEEDWEEYTFKGQPVALDERPPQWAPYHLRLDWQLWFAAMQPRPTPRQRWLFALLHQLLQDDEDALSLVDHNPFPGEPPDQVRVRRYRYTFTEPEERRETGDWWNRELENEYLRPVSLDDPQFRRVLRRYGYLD
ncbi:MAG: lipase maturation factor family protein [Candidatus Nanohaloarchaea archaeon]|nr:lipase maturation factor family protein [Candidatus Nanohaloarchaea archaeon]